MSDIMMIRKEMIRIARDQNPDAKALRIATGQDGADYVEGQFNNDLGEFSSSIHGGKEPSFVWMSLGIWSDEVEQMLEQTEGEVV